MIRPAALLLVLALAGTARAASDPVAAAEDAAGQLRTAAEGLAAAERARDRVAALTDTVHAYEAGLAAMRDGVRRAALREAEIRTRFEREEAQLSALLGALLSMQRTPADLALIHPEGPLRTARAGILVADVTPAIEARVARLRTELGELEQLRTLQDGARRTLQTALDGAQAARTALAQAISERTPRPNPANTDQAVLQALLNGADTLQGFAESLATIDGAAPSRAGFAAARGQLPLPVSGTVLAGFREADAAGIRRPGILLATRPAALVTAPAAATVRYAGPLLDLGQVVILEPEAGTLMILAGLGQAYVARGTVLAAGAPLGLMGGDAPGVDQILIESSPGGGQARSQTLYIEFRNAGTPMDPAEWFAPVTE